MNDSSIMFHMEIGKDFSNKLEDLSKLNEDCFDGLYELALKEVLQSYGVENEKQIPEDKRKGFSMAMHNNRYMQLNNQIFLLIDCGLKMFGKYTESSRYGTLFCDNELKEKKDEHNIQE